VRGVTLSAMVLAASAALGGAASASPTAGEPPPVALRLPSHTLRAGQSVEVKIINRTSRELLVSSCFLLQLRRAHSWKTITRTHGVHVPCSLTNGVPLSAGQRSDFTSLILYDDLQPGAYRITMAYKVLPEHWRTASLKRNHRLLKATVMVLPFDPGTPPKLAETRIRRIALKAAAGGHPTLIQHAEGTRFEANLIAGGDLVYEWTWAYLIAIKGHFKFTPPSPGPSRPHTYSAITLVVDAKTGQTEDFGISNDYPDIAKLGPVTTDYRR
jgi:hypothetical protein